MMGRREYIIQNLFKKDFITKIQDRVFLEEKEEQGKSQLIVEINSSSNYCIEHFDDESMTSIGFFRTEKQISMRKRVDHIIFENVSDNLWNIHLIEMKTTVGHSTWRDEKGKFRASFLLSEAVAAMLGMDIKDVKMYTTYEKVDLRSNEYSPTEHRGRVGQKMARPEEEWNGRNFCLNFGEKIKFTHIPIKMMRNENGLYGIMKI